MKIKLLVVLGIFFASGLFAGSIAPSNRIDSAQAAKWGGCAGAVGQCPGTSGPISTCVDSAEFKVNINGTGPLPPGQGFVVDIFPDDGSTACSDVTCLKRDTHYTGLSWNNQPISETFDQIGCSTGACANNYTVNVYFNEPKLPGTENCSIPNSIQKWAGIQNGVQREFTFTFNCTTPPSPSPSCPVLAAPVVTVKCPNCP